MSSIIDLRSDTVTRPTPEMYAAMASAPLGDDQLGDDPTVIQLQELAAERLGMEAALFVPTGIMANMLGVRLFSRPGDRVLCEARAHLYGASVVAMSGATPVILRGDKYGQFDLDELTMALTPDVHGESMALLCLEDTFNEAGGTALSPEYLAAAADVAHARGVPVYLDGARLFNAAVALGVDAKALTRHVDAVMFCTSKGLSSPVGSLLCASRELIAEAARLRYLLGGAMRQAGILAACGIVALQRMVDRLAEDHANARLIAEGLASIEGVGLDLDVVQTNLIWFDLAGSGVPAGLFARRLQEQGVLLFAITPTLLRAVTHKDVSRSDAQRALDVMRSTLRELREEKRPI